MWHFLLSFMRKYMFKYLGFPCWCSLIFIFYISDTVTFQLPQVVCVWLWLWPCMWIKVSQLAGLCPKMIWTQLTIVSYGTPMRSRRFIRHIKGYWNGSNEDNFVRESVVWALATMIFFYFLWSHIYCDQEKEEDDVIHRKLHSTRYFLW